MSFDFAEINYWAVLVSAVATFMVGGLWYGLLFAKKWVAVHGFSEDQVAAMQKKQGRNFGIFFVGDLIMGVIVSLLVINLDVTTAAGGAGLAFFVWLGISATTGAAKNAAYNKSLVAYAIDTCHELVALVVMGLIIGGWR